MYPALIHVDKFFDTSICQNDSGTAILDASAEAPFKKHALTAFSQPMRNLFLSLWIWKLPTPFLPHPIQGRGVAKRICALKMIQLLILEMGDYASPCLSLSSFP